MLIELGELAVDPSATKRRFDSLIFTDRGFGCANLGQLEPKARRLRRFAGHVGLDGYYVRERQDWSFRYRHMKGLILKVQLNRSVKSVFDRHRTSAKFTRRSLIHHHELGCIHGIA